MAGLSTWLSRVGFVHGNPFAITEADKEADLLRYAVGHPILNAILDADQQPVSGILHAPRGAGKSTMRRLFEERYRWAGDVERALVVSLTDWMPIVARRHEAGFGQAEPHIDTIGLQLLRALALDPNPTPAAPAPYDGYLGWLYEQRRAALTADERGLLEHRFPELVAGSPARADYSLASFPAAQQLAVLSRLVRSLSYGVCYILVDRIDELVETTNNWELGAELIAPLLGNLPLVEVPHLAFKCFLPSDLVAVLRRQQLLREDRLPCVQIVWDSDLLSSLLMSRLAHFSDGAIRRLAELAVASTRDVDELLVRAADGSPRTLLNLGNALVHACAASADEGRWQIDLGHLRLVLPIGGEELSTAQESPPSRIVAPEMVPPLRIRGGRLWFGESEHLEWQRLPDLQRRLLQYLYDHRGTICRKEDIIAELWVTPPADNGSLRKLGERLTKAIEPAPEHPRYIRTVWGGHFRLDNAAD